MPAQMHIHKHAHTHTRAHSYTELETAFKLGEIIWGSWGLATSCSCPGHPMLLLWPPHSLVVATPCFCLGHPMLLSWTPYWLPNAAVHTVYQNVWALLSLIPCHPMCPPNIKSLDSPLLLYYSCYYFTSYFYIDNSSCNV